jgi:hypothetical protein
VEIRGAHHITKRTRFKAMIASLAGKRAAFLQIRPRCRRSGFSVLSITGTRELSEFRSESGFSVIGSRPYCSRL